MTYWKGKTSERSLSGAARHEMNSTGIHLVSHANEVCVYRIEQSEIYRIERSEIYRIERSEIYRIERSEIYCIEQGEIVPTVRYTFCILAESEICKKCDIFLRNAICLCILAESEICKKRDMSLRDVRRGG